MKTSLLTAAWLASCLLSPLTASAQDDTRCAGNLLGVAGVSLSAPRTASVDFSGSGGQLDALLDTDVTVRGQAASCLLIQFSAMAYPQDNAIVFQVLVDGVPVPGQSALPGFPGIPVVFDPEETDNNLGRMVSHSFVAPVAPGLRRVELRFAGCCSPNPGSGVVNSATLSVQHR
jgi:hypothetical protein